jgi:hypothetical protein
MSIVALMQDAAEANDPNTNVTRGRKATLKAGRGDRRADAPEPPASPFAAVATELTRYIPTEAIGLYTVILPFMVSEGKPLTEQNFTGRWLLSLGVAILALLFAVGVYRKEVKSRGQEFHWPPKRTITVLVAFVAWVMVIPGSPFQDFSWFSPVIGGIVGFATVAVLGLFSLWFGEVES